MTTRISRREAVQRVIALMGGLALVIDEERLLAAAIDDAVLSRTLSQGVGSFTAADIALLDEIADTILPTTSTPGAKAAKTGPFMALMVTDVYSDRDQQVFRDGMRALEDACRTATGGGFLQATPAQRLALLEALDREQRTTAEERLSFRTRYPAPPPPPEEAAPHYFRMMKELALLGYFTSEIGYTKAMRYRESPGRFDPDVPLAPGETSWAPHA
jgi:hypothetical protein